MNNKFIKILIIVNGLLIPVFVGWTVYKVAFADSYDSYEPDGIIVGDELDKAMQDSLALQGISYEMPEQVYNSSNLYIPVSARTYEEALALKRISESAGDFYAGAYNNVNVLFLDKNYKVIGSLLDRKASVNSIQNGPDNYYNNRQEIDTTFRHLAYLIGFEDSNKDGRLNSEDDHDLYLSDLSGKNLTQVTSGVDVDQYTFIQSNTRILIRYKERNALRDEHNPIRLALYDIRARELTPLEDVHLALREIESILISK